MLRYPSFIQLHLLNLFKGLHDLCGCNLLLPHILIGSLKITADCLITLMKPLKLDLQMLQLLLNLFHMLIALYTR